MNKWYIGQKVVCVKAHPKGVVVEGCTYVIGGIRASFCACQELELDVGVRDSIIRFSHCTHCGTRYPSNDYVWWLSEARFRPLESGYTEEEIDAVNIDELIEPLLETIER